ncbi:hypothetical protein FISHEDRAFT_11429, partial [Fistulina hepatica ATCC 64428]
LQEMWRGRSYLFVDKFSMLCKTFLSKLSRQIALGKAGDPDFDPNAPFGGKSGDSLFYEIAVGDTNEMLKGRKIYESFDTVVILTEQCRVTDPQWKSFLHKLRLGELEEDDLQILDEIQLKEEDKTTYRSEQWTKAVLVTPRHGVRRQWNHQAIRQHCKLTGQKLYVCPAHDTIANRRLSPLEKFVAQVREAKNNKGLPQSVEIAIGADVSITQNLDTDLDITNGARGKISGIVLDENEPIHDDDDAVVTLQFPPRYVLVQMDRTRT